MKLSRKTIQEQILSQVLLARDQLKQIGMFFLPPGTMAYYSHAPSGILDVNIDGVHQNPGSGQSIPPRRQSEAV